MVDNMQEDIYINILNNVARMVLWLRVIGNPCQLAPDISLGPSSNPTVLKTMQ